MDIHDMEDRLFGIEKTLALVADGNFEESLHVSGREDALTRVEMGINFMVMDLRAMTQADREKEERLLQQQRELVEKLRTIEEQAAAIRELSTPVMEIWDDVLVLPIVGVVDTHRSLDIMTNLLDRIVQKQARCVILDVTGVEIVDTKTADYLLKVVRAANLLGTRCVLTGLSPAVAQTLVEVGADLKEVPTLRTLKDGLRHCLAFLRRGEDSQKA